MTPGSRPFIAPAAALVAAAAFAAAPAQAAPSLAQDAPSLAQDAPSLAQAAARAKAKPAAPAVTAVSGPRAAVAARALVVLAATARNPRGARSARATISFHASADRRLDRRDLKLGGGRTARLRPGRRGSVSIAVRLPAAASGASWTLLACSSGSSGRAQVCKAAPRKLVVRAAQQTRPGGTPTPPPIGPPSHPPSGPPQDDGPAPPPPLPAPSLTAQLSSGIEWGEFRDADGGSPDAGAAVTTRLRLGAGVAGASGYERTTVASAPAVTGTETTLADGLSFPGADDLSIPARLPFAFPFAGVATDAIAVSSNGWIGLAGPAWGWRLPWADDYRGAAAAAGANLAAIAPLRSDFELEGPLADDGRIVLVEPAGGERVAIRWEVYPIAGGADRAREVFEAVLFRDGRIRFDYLERPPIADPRPSAIGISPGVAGRLADLDLDLLPQPPAELPAESILFTPRAVSPTAVAPGAVTVALPRGSSLAGGSPGCAEQQTPTLARAGSARCATPAVAAGGTATVELTWTYPQEEVVGFPRLAASWEPAPLPGAPATGADGAEELLPGRYAAGAGATFSPLVTATGADAWTATAGASAPGLDRLRRPRLRGTLPAGLTLTGIVSGASTISGAQLAQLCDPLPEPATAGGFDCLLSDGLHASWSIRLQGAGPGPYALPLTLTADNLPQPLSATATIG